MLHTEYLAAMSDESDVDMDGGMVLPPVVSKRRGGRTPGADSMDLDTAFAFTISPPGGSMTEISMMRTPDETSMMRTPDEMSMSMMRTPDVLALEISPVPAAAPAPAPLHEMDLSMSMMRAPLRKPKMMVAAAAPTATTAATVASISLAVTPAGSTSPPVTHALPPIKTVKSRRSSSARKKHACAHRHERAHTHSHVHARGMGTAAAGGAKNKAKGKAANTCSICDRKGTRRVKASWIMREDLSRRPRSGWRVCSTHYMALYRHFRGDTHQPHTACVHFDTMRQECKDRWYSFRAIGLELFPVLPEHGQAPPQMPPPPAAAAAAAPAVVADPDGGASDSDDLDLVDIVDGVFWTPTLSSTAVPMA